MHDSKRSSGASQPPVVSNPDKQENMDAKDSAGCEIDEETTDSEGERISEKRISEKSDAPIG